MNYIIKYEFPNNKDYLSLFKSVGWQRLDEMINIIRDNSKFCVSIYENENIVAMGRIIGDGCYYTICDVVVDKDKQHNGYGSVVMKKLVDWYQTIMTDDTYLYLGASKNMEPFYEKFGFLSRPNSEIGAGMKWYNKQEFEKLKNR